MNSRSDSGSIAMRRLRMAALWLLAAGAFGAANCAPAQTDASVISGTQIKAAFLYNFTKFVEWPDETFASDDVPLTIGVVGETPLAGDLRTIVDGRLVNGRPIAVRTIREPADIGDVQLLFVDEGEDERLTELLAVVRDTPVLTVGNSVAFIDAGGAIAFVQQGTKLRFEINMTSAELARLKISAQLQELAVAVRRAGQR